MWNYSTKTSRPGIKLPSGEVVDVVEWQDYVMEVDLEIGTNITSQHAFQMAQQEQFLIFSVEAATRGDVERSVLQGCELEISASDRPWLRIALNHIATHDSVLEARIGRLENLIDGILTTEMDEGSLDPVERRMAERRAVLVRLGYKPYEPLDHRRLTKVAHYGGCERGLVRIVCDATVPATPMTCRITLRGVRKVPCA